MRLLRYFLIIISISWAQAETVVCSFSILKDLCVQLCQGIEGISVHSIVPVSADPHLYHPKPSDSKILAKADLIIVNGLNLEGWIEQLIRASGHTCAFAVASQNIPPRYLGNLPDPHVWHDPTLVMTMIDNIENALKVAFPKYASNFEKNAIGLRAVFKELHTNIVILFSKIEKPERVMLTTHDAFSYFAKCFDVTVLSPHGISTSDDPSAKDLKNLITQIRDLHISAIFLESLANPKIINVIATETGKQIKGTLYADTLKEGLSLQDTLWYNAATMAEAMKNG